MNQMLEKSRIESLAVKSERSYRTKRTDCCASGQLGPFSGPEIVMAGLG